MKEIENDNIVHKNDFMYNIPLKLDICFKEIIVPITKIKIDGYEIGVNHRPIRQPHVNKIKASFMGDYDNIKVVYSSLDECYHILQRQHLFVAIKQLMNEGKIKSIIPDTKDGLIKCDLILRKSTGQQLDVQNIEDKGLCFKYSYRVTDVQERNCISDTIWMILQLSNEYMEKTGKIHGVFDYIYENQYGYRKLSIETVKTYKKYGDELRKLQLLETSQKERWSKEQIKAEIEKYKLQSGNMKELKLKLPEWAYDELMKKGFNNVSVYLDIARTPESFNAKFLSRVIYEIK